MKGNVGVIISMVVTLGLYGLAKRIEPVQDPYQLIVQVTGLLGSMCLAWSFILATRHRLLERWFGGLDHVYKIHHIVGGLSLVLLLQHPIFLLIRALPVNLLSLYFIPGMRLDYSLGQMALYLMIFLLILTFYIPLPYRFWKWTHEWLGAVMLLGALHSILVDSDVKFYLPLTMWIGAWSVLSLAAYVYKRWLYYRLAKSAVYILEQKHVEGSLLVMELVAEGTGLDFAPGQYGFFARERSRDEHAFSILDGSGAKIVIGVKIMKNFTKVMAGFDIGARLEVRGPFGMFAEKLPQAAHAVWIAGGIGITPFASMLSIVRPEQKVEMFFCANVMPPASLTSTFVQYAENHPNFSFMACETSKQGRLSAEQIWTQTGNDVQAYYFLCGPKKMMEQIAGDLVKKRIKKSHIIYEDFGFK